MELYQLESFAEVARLGNLTRAADTLNVSQSALSSQLKALEDELGVKLFNRLPKGMELTDNGRVLLTHAREVLDARTSLSRKALSLRGSPSLSVTIGLNADPTFLKVSEMNKRLAGLERPPNVIFLTSQTVRTAEMLRKGSIDIGFFYGISEERDVLQTVVSQVRIFTVIPTGLSMGREALEWEDVAVLPWIWVMSDCPFYEIMGKRMEMRNLFPNRKVVAADEQVVKELVMAGQGVAMIREDEAYPLVRDGLVKVWAEGELGMQLSIGWLKDNRKEKPLAEVVDTIVSVWKKD